jgi:hypothetical protein
LIEASLPAHAEASQEDDRVVRVCAICDAKTSAANFRRRSAALVIASDIKDLTPQRLD